MKHLYVINIKGLVHNIQVEASSPLEALNRVVKEKGYNSTKICKVSGYKHCDAWVVLLNSRVHRVAYYKCFKESKMLVL